MKKRNGRYYRKYKTIMGRVLWVEMSEREVIETDIYRAALVVLPLIGIALMAWAAGMI